MFKNHNILSYLWYSVAAALLFCITVFIFLQNQEYSSTWWLYVGNALFMIVIFYFVWGFNKRKAENASSTSLIMAGHITSVLGIIIACIVSFILISVMVPALYQSGETGTTVAGAPATIDTGKTDGLMFIIFMNAIVGNIAAGSFVSILFAFSVKRDQTKDSAEIKYKIPE